MIYLLPAGNTFAIYPVKPDVEGVIEIDQLPEGEGILKRNEQGEFYFERFPEVVNPPIIEPPIEPDQQRPELSLEAMQAKILLNTEMLLLQKEIGI